MAEKEEVFEIIDHTTVSPWERFVASLEILLKDWLSMATIDKSPITTTITYDDKEYDVQFYSNRKANNENNQTINEKEEFPETPTKRKSKKSKQIQQSENLHPQISNMLNHKHDFETHASQIQRWFGISDYILISSSTREISSSETTQILSSFACALEQILKSTIISSPQLKQINNNNNNAEIQRLKSYVSVPVLVAMQAKWKGVYCGKLFTSNYNEQWRFDSDLLSSIPTNFYEFSNLVDYFATNVQSPRAEHNYESNHYEMISVATRFTYIIPRAMLFGKDIENDDEEEISQNSVRTPTPSEQHGNRRDLTRSALVAKNLDYLTDFSHTSRRLFEVEGLYDTDKAFEKFQAESWVFRYVLRDSNVETTPFSARLKSLFSLKQEYNGTKRDVTAIFATPMGVLSSAFESLPNSEELNDILTFIFVPSRKREKNPNPERMICKAAPTESLLTQFFLCLCDYASVKAVNIIWREFLREVRWHWENLVELPSIDPEPISYESCLIFQKLQMLNFCIAQQSKSHELKNKNKRGKSKQKEETNESNENKEEKEGDGGWNVDFDVESEKEEEIENTKEEENHKSLETSTTNAEELNWTKRGILKQHENQTLLNSSSEPLNVPITQTHGVLTEDMISEQEEILMKIKSTESESSEIDQIQKRMQNALISDMEAFKAANGEKSTLIDFVRWHSPRDWNSETKSLSTRMQQSGNLWQKLWSESNPVSAQEQMPIFDSVVNAEKVLHYLDTLPMEQVIEQMLNVVLQKYYETFLTDVKTNKNKYSGCIEDMTSALTQISTLIQERNQLSDKSDYDFDGLYHAFLAFEYFTYTCLSLKQLFPFLPAEILTSLLHENEISLPEVVRGDIFDKLFPNATVENYLPDAREFIFRKEQHRMYALLSDREFRLALCRKKE